MIKDGAVYDEWQAYGQSKTANMLFSVALAKRLGPKGLVSTSLHPGIAYTNLAVHIDFANGGAAGMKRAETLIGTKASVEETAYDFKTPDQAVATHVFTAFAPQAGTKSNGKYFMTCAVANQYEGEIFPWATDEIEADRLWKLSEKLVGQVFGV